jgi:hypothetical protein
MEITQHLAFGSVLVLTVLYILLIVNERDRTINSINECLLPHHSPDCANNLSHALFPRSLLIWNVLKVVIIATIICGVILKASSIRNATRRLIETGREIEQCVLDSSSKITPSASASE